MEFPTLVYKCPGNHQRPGGTYAYKGVKDAGQHAEALAGGWFATLPEAIEGRPTPAPEPPAAVPAVDAPPTRAELEQKANELNIKFDRRIGDKKLQALIDEKLKA